MSDASWVMDGLNASGIEEMPQGCGKFIRKPKTPNTINLALTQKHHRR